jgi:hypothetical protein
MVLADLTQERLEELEQIEIMFQCLETVGVDLWDGWTEAIEIYNKRRWK